MSKRWLKWLKRGLLCCLVLAVAGWFIGRALLQSWAAKPPPIPPDATVLKLKPETRDGRVWLGKSWFGHREGLPVVCLKGTPFEIGYANGLLLQPQMRTLENEFLDMVHGYVPEGLRMDLIKDYIIYRNRHLTDYVSRDRQLELLGITLGNPDVHPELGPYYNRLLNYHAAHDVSYMLIDNPLISKAGCTAFGAWGTATMGGHLITGRNFDWEAAEVFSRDRVVILCEPDGRIPFASLSWAGMAGVVSGMNRAGVSVTVNGAPSSLPGETATPVALVARDILEQAHNLTEATQILRNAKVFVSTIWLVGSRTDGRFISVEKSPARTEVRESTNNNSIVCGNHFLTAALGGDARNQTYTAEATSVSRAARMSELIEGTQGKLDAVLAAEFLRDRKLAGGKFPGNGHRGTLNAFIATHATVMDLTDGIFWASSPPNQFGKFVAFDLADFDRELPALIVPADPVLASGEFDRTKEARGLLAAAEKALKAKEAATALADAEKAESLNPGFYWNATVRGKALEMLGRKQEAATAYAAALAAHPAFLKETQDLEASLRRLQPNP